MDEFYHTYNRGVEKRKIFLNESDYFRGIHDLYEFNDINAVLNLTRKLEGSPTSLNPSDAPLGRKREKLVDLFVWGFMPNHYHLFLSPIKDKGIQEFHRKLGCGFTNFFNLKYKRSGVLFQGGYKKVSVENDTQAIQLICYIHSNPLDLWKPGWKEKGLTSFEIENASKFLEKYRWSSHLDWWGIKNYPSLINKEFMNRFFKNSEEYREFFINWLKHYEKNITNLQKLILEK